MKPDALKQLQHIPWWLAPWVAYKRWQTLNREQYLWQVKRDTLVAVAVVQGEVKHHATGMIALTHSWELWASASGKREVKFTAIGAGAKIADHRVYAEIVRPWEIGLLSNTQVKNIKMHWPNDKKD